MRYAREVTEDYLVRVGRIIRDARRHKQLTQHELAASLNTSQSAVARIEAEAAFRTLLERTSDITLDVPDVEYRPSLIHRGIRELPVRLHPA